MKLSKQNKVLDRYTGQDTRVVIPYGVEQIADGAFDGCNSMVYLSIPNTVKKIGQGAFHGCSNLRSIRFPDSVEELGHSVCFQCTSLKNVVLSSGLRTVPQYAFQQCPSLEQIEIPAGVETIDENAFCSCENLETVTLSEGLLRIQANAFSLCKKLANFTMPDSVFEVNHTAFTGCELIPPEQKAPRLLPFYTVTSEKERNGALRIGDHYVVQQGYTREDRTRIKEEAQEYRLRYVGRSERCTWHTDGKTEAVSEDRIAKIVDEDILVKNGHFYGCILTYQSSYRSYHHADETEKKVLVLFGAEEGVRIRSIDHDSDNGEYTASTYAYLIRA